MKRNQRGRDYLRECRRKIIKLLGGKCVTCGFSDPRALQVDHVNGDGYKYKRGIGRTYCNSSMLKMIQRSIDNNTNEFQLLCANCNSIKCHENNEKPRSRGPLYEPQHLVSWLNSNPHKETTNGVH